jgi:GT2 family glycosyltransferase/thioredoxin-like negative regulator of GroEL
MESPDLRSALGRAGKRHWQGCFNWERVTDAWEALINNGPQHNPFNMPVEAEEIMKSITGESQMRTIDQPADSPLVSVIVPTHNRPDMLVDTIRSILNQSYRNFEIIVVNDGGADVEGVVHHLNRDGNITYVRHSRNRGLAAARNTGIRVSRGKYIAYLDDDDIFYPDHLETLVSFLEGSAFRVAYTDAHRAHQTMNNGRLCVTARDLPYSYDFDYDTILVTNFVPVLCFMHERSCIDQVGSFDEELTTHEDWDMWIRMSREFQFAHIKKVTCEFSWRQDGSTMTSSRHADFIRTTQVIYEKHEALAAGKPAVQEAKRNTLEAREKALAPQQSRERGVEQGQRDAISAKKVSIIIPVFNGVEYTRQCIDQLLAVTDRAIPHEIIVVDNASTDGTAQFLAKLQGDIRVITNRENLGFARACNHGARLATGDYLVYLNNDTIPQAGWLEALIEGVEHDGADICGSLLLYPDGSVQHAGVAFDERGIGYHIFKGHDAKDPGVTRKRFMQCVTGACMLIRKDLFAELGGFDEGYQNGYEDVDLCLRAGEKGGRILYVPESVLVHFEGATEGRELHEKQNAARFFERWRGKVRCDDNGFYHLEGCSKQILPDGRVRLFRGEKQGTPSSAGGEGGPSLERRLERADGLAREGKFDDAVALYRSVLRGEPGNVRAMTGIGVAMLMTGDLGEAASSFSRALAIDPADGKALSGLGMVNSLEGKDDEAFACFSRALDSDPENLTALAELLKCSYRLDRFKEVEQRLESYLRYHPADLNMLYSLAGVQVKMGKNGEASQKLETILLFDPGFEGALEMQRVIEGELPIAV